MITLVFAVNRRIEPQGYTKENKKQEKYALKEIFLQGNQERNAPTKL
jgi:hypothetical protein